MMELTNTYAVVDVETTITPHMKRKASPFTDENWIVAAGWKFNGGEVQGAYYGEDKDGYRGLMRKDLERMPIFTARGAAAWPGAPVTGTLACGAVLLACWWRWRHAAARP